MKCKTCGKKHSADIKFCAYCGTPVQQPGDAKRNLSMTADNAENHVKCPICGKINKMSYRFCTYCGAFVLPQSNSNLTGKKSGLKTIGRAFAAIMLLIAVVLDALLVYDFVNNI